jgi:hypothetical protein
MIRDAGHVRILAPGGAELDRLGWGVGARAPEMRPVPISATDIYERKAVATSTMATMAPGGTDQDRGNGYDSDDNSADFVPRAMRDPQNTLSPLE